MSATGTSFPSPNEAATVAVSFIVPLFNCLDLTRRMVASLQATVPPGLSHEIILIDDGSTDGTRDWLRTQPGAIRVLLNERNLGYAATNNRAVASARGEVLVLLNSDLVFLPGWLPPMMAAHRRLGTRAGLVGNVQVNARTGAVDHVGIVFNAKAKPEHDRTPPFFAEPWLRPIRPVPAVTAACVLLARGLWTELGGFDDGFVNGGEDIDLCFRARAAGRVNAVALRSVVRHFVSSSPGRKDRDEQNSERLMRRWRSEFIACASRVWCTEQLAIAEPSHHGAAWLAGLWLHSLGLTASPPRQAILGLEESVERELERWEQLRRNRA